MEQGGPKNKIEQTSLKKKKIKHKNAAQSL